jgi:hypothetical protein
MVLSFHSSGVLTLHILELCKCLWEAGNGNIQHRAEGLQARVSGLCYHRVRATSYAVCIPSTVLAELQPSILLSL